MRNEPWIKGRVCPAVGAPAAINQALLSGAGAHHPAADMVNTVLRAVPLVGNTETLPPLGLPLVTSVTELIETAPVAVSLAVRVTVREESGGIEPAFSTRLAEESETAAAASSHVWLSARTR